VSLEVKLQEKSLELNSAYEIKVLQKEISSTPLLSEHVQPPQHNLEAGRTPTEDRDPKWYIPKPRKSARSQNHNYSNCKGIPVLVNRYEVLQSLSAPRIDDGRDVQKYHASIKHSASHGNKDRKIVIIGESQAKGCAADLTQAIGNTSEVIGYVKPGSRLENKENCEK
jgi:hypothetical protein